MSCSSCTVSTPGEDLHSAGLDRLVARGLGADVHQSVGLERAAGLKAFGAVGGLNGKGRCQTAGIGKELRQELAAAVGQYPGQS